MNGMAIADIDNDGFLDLLSASGSVSSDERKLVWYKGTCNELSSRDACVNDTLNFPITISGDSLRWQVFRGLYWENLKDGLNPHGGDYAGVRTDSLVLNGVDAAMDNYQYRCAIYECDTLSGFSGIINLEVHPSLSNPLVSPAPNALDIDPATEILLIFPDATIDGSTVTSSSLSIYSSTSGLVSGTADTVSGSSVISPLMISLSPGKKSP